MDAFLGWLFIFLLFGGWRLLAWLFRVGGGALSDATDGRATFKEGVAARATGMSGLDMRVEDTVVGENEIPVWQVKIRGLFNVSQPANLAIVLSVLDVTDQNDAQPILCAFDDLQEPDTRAFQLVCKLGRAEPGQGFLHWVGVGAVPKDLLMYPLSGNRKIGIVVRLVDQDRMPRINQGFSDPKHSGTIKEFMHTVSVAVERGFLERSTDELGVAAASVRLGLALAYADGHFDPLEGKLIKEWAAKFVNEAPEGKGRVDARSFINDAIRFGNEDAKARNLPISSQLEILNKLADKPQKYAAIELCLDVMAADGSADEQELKLLNMLCYSLGLDKERFSELRDRRMINVRSAKIDGSNIWDTLGIDSAASDDVKRSELRTLYRRWNARAESLENESEREKAHETLELIAEARSLLNA